ncbi:MAG: GDP-mannose 4,6-dehydratase [Dehalococcoidales bacterium]
MSIKNKRVFVTGISGFVGSHMAKYLVDTGASVSGLLNRQADEHTTQNLKYLGIDREVELIEGDIRDISSIASALDQAKPDLVFHFAAQSFIPRSFSHPLETVEVNCQGTVNLLESIRAKGLDPVVVYAGSSEEYGLVIISEHQYQQVLSKYGLIFPQPKHIPEVPVTETNPLRPMSPYAVSKVFADYMVRNYFTSYGMKTIVSRGFNHEGPGRDKRFVTSWITSQVTGLKRGDIDRIRIGNVNAFRDWSHINDIIKGYCLLAERGKPGDVYNQGSQRTNSVLTYILLSLESAGYNITKIQTIRGNKVVKAPAEVDNSEIFGLNFEKTKVDRLMLEGNLEFDTSDAGIIASTEKGAVTIEFDTEKLRPSDVPVLLSETAKIRQIGFNVNHSLKDIINDQLNYFLEPTR